MVFNFFAFQVENLFRIRLPFTELKNPFSKSKDIKILEKVVKLVEKSQNAKKTINKRFDLMACLLRRSFSPF